MSWEYVSKSPGGGICYYNEKRDICVMKYPSKFRVYSRAVRSSVKQPCGFDLRSKEYGRKSL